MTEACTHEELQTSTICSHPIGGRGRSSPKSLWAFSVRRSSMESKGGNDNVKDKTSSVCLVARLLPPTQET